ILWLLREASGVDFSHYRPDVIRQRVKLRITLLKLDGMEAYVVYLSCHKEEAEILQQEILTGVTGFFCDPEAFEALKEKVFPELVKQRAGDEPLRVWVVGCSTGEEAYSIAIAFLEFAETRDKHIPIQIFATDLNNDAIAQARAGYYTQKIVNDVSSERLRRFFDKTLSGYKISKSVREMCVFARHNALTDPPFSNMDMVSCRDLLIRLDAGMRKRAIYTLQYSLKPSGFLL